MREGYAPDAHQLGRYAARGRLVILIATVLDLEARFTDAVLEMADKLIGGLFAKARNARHRRYEASAGDVGRVMRLFHGTIGALAAAQTDDRDAFEVVDETVDGRSCCGCVPRWKSCQSGVHVSNRPKVTIRKVSRISGV